MKTKLAILSVVAVLCLTAAPTLADPFPVSVQNVLDDITVSGTSSVVAATDFIDDDRDSTWQFTATGSGAHTLIVRLPNPLTLVSGLAFGIYDYADPTNRVEIFDGTAADGDTRTMSIKGDGRVFKSDSYTGTDFAGTLFGYYLDATVATNNPGNIYYSDSSLNPDLGVDQMGLDHMYAYQGTGDEVQLPGLGAAPWTPSEYILAWEAAFGLGDSDFDDFVVMVESVQPVPVPGAVLLGLLGLGVAGRKLRKRG